MKHHFVVRANANGVCDRRGAAEDLAFNDKHMAVFCMGCCNGLDLDQDPK